MNIHSPLEAQQADGFVDFYALTGSAPDTSSEELRDTINAQYKDAQNDRGHRTPARRHEASLLLELLPQARTVLLDPKRRRRYNAYREAVAMQSPRMPFEEFLPSLLRETRDAPVAADILSMADLNRELRSRTKVAPSAASVSTSTSASSDASGEKIEEATQMLSFPPTWLPSLLGAATTFIGGITSLCLLAHVPFVLSFLLSFLCSTVVAHVFPLADNWEAA